MEIRKEILDELLKDYKNPEDLPGEEGLLKQLTKALLERAMQAELTPEPGYEKNDKSSLKETANRRGRNVGENGSLQPRRDRFECSERSAFGV